MAPGCKPKKKVYRATDSPSIDQLRSPQHKKQQLASSAMLVNDSTAYCPELKRTFAGQGFEHSLNDKF